MNAIENELKAIIVDELPACDFVVPAITGVVVHLEVYDVRSERVLLIEASETLAVVEMDCAVDCYVDVATRGLSGFVELPITIEIELTLDGSSDGRQMTVNKVTLPPSPIGFDSRGIHDYVAPRTPRAPKLVRRRAQGHR